MPSPFDRLMDTIRPHLPGSIDRAIKQELFILCNDFFKATNVWQEEIDFTMLAGNKTASVNPTTGRINNLLSVKNTDDITVGGFFMTTPGVVEARYEYTVDTDYTGVFGITVSDPADVDSFPIVPSDTVERYTEELINGILSRMMAQPSKPYSNPGMAQFYLVNYRGGRARARHENNIGNTYGSQRWAFPQSFRVR
jgi:hypothetical protein